jgi:hypothetical protein
VLLTTGWVAVAVAGLCAMGRKTFRPYIREHRAESIFAFLYLGFILTYNSVEWARAEFPRFVIGHAISPFVFWPVASEIALCPIRTLRSIPSSSGFLSHWYPQCSAGTALGRRSVAQRLRIRLTGLPRGRGQTSSLVVCRWSLENRRPLERAAFSSSWGWTDYNQMLVSGSQFSDEGTCHFCISVAS